MSKCSTEAACLDPFQVDGAGADRLAHLDAVTSNILAGLGTAPAGTEGQGTAPAGHRQGTAEHGQGTGGTAAGVVGHKHVAKRQGGPVVWSPFVVGRCKRSGRYLASNESSQEVIS